MPGDVGDRQDAVLGVDGIVEDARDQDVALIDRRPVAGDVVERVGADRDGHARPESNGPAQGVAAIGRDPRRPAEVEQHRREEGERQRDGKPAQGRRTEEQPDGERGLPAQGQEDGPHHQHDRRTVGQVPARADLRHEPEDGPEAEHGGQEEADPVGQGEFAEDEPGEADPDAAEHAAGELLREVRAPDEDERHEQDARHRWIGDVVDAGSVGDELVEPGWRVGQVDATVEERRGETDEVIERLPIA